MDEIYVNAIHFKSENPIPSTNHTATRNSKRNFSVGAIVILGLLSVFLLTGLITLGVRYHDLLWDSAADLSAVSNKLSSMTEERDQLHKNLSAMSIKLSSMTVERNQLQGDLSAMSNRLSSMTVERNRLQVSLNEKTKELERLQSLINQKKTCPGGWTMFSDSCYLLSISTGSWDTARYDCIYKGANLVVINCAEEQTFLSAMTTVKTWIGLNDKDNEGTWKWVDGTPLTLANWDSSEPNNGGFLGGQEDCAHLRTDGKRTWNDESCTDPMKWICEKKIP